MSRFYIKPQLDSDFRWSCDVDRIVHDFAELGHEISWIDAKLAWEAYSHSMGAGWMNLPKSAHDTFQRVRHCLEEVEYE